MYSCTVPKRKSGAAHATANYKLDVNWSFMYLQMEFCPRTLKKILVAGPIEEADAWQVGSHQHHSLSDPT